MNASELTITIAPGRRSSRLARSAAGFSATSTSGWSAGVRMSSEAKWTWKPETPGQRAGRCADLGGEVREGREVVAEEGGGLGELGAGELHAVAGVAGEADRRPARALRPASLGSARRPRWCRRRRTAQRRPVRIVSPRQAGGKGGPQSRGSYGTSPKSHGGGAALRVAPASGESLKLRAPSRRISPRVLPAHHPFVGRPGPRPRACGSRSTPPWWRPRSCPSGRPGPRS